MSGHFAFLFGKGGKGKREPGTKVDYCFVVLNIHEAKFYNPRAVADPELELRGGPGFVLLALPAFLPSVIYSSFKAGDRAPGPLP